MASTAKKQPKGPAIPVPFQDRIIISKVKPEEVTSGGIIIPDQAIEDENIGIVMAVGPTVGKSATRSLLDGEIYIPKVGDTVFFGEYAGIDIPGTDFMVVKEIDVLCKI